MNVVGVMMGAAMTNKTQNILNKKNIMRATERKVYFEVVEQHVHEYVYKYWRNAYTRMKVYKISNTRGAGLFGDA